MTLYSMKLKRRNLNDTEFSEVPSPQSTPSSPSSPLSLIHDNNEKGMSPQNAYSKQQSNCSPQPQQHQRHQQSQSEDWSTIALITISALFLILQSYAFRNVALQTTGLWSPYNRINDHHHHPPTWCPYAKCQNSPRCKPCQRRFLIIIATGRSGSTTLMNLLDLLPGVRMAGENNGQILNDYKTWKNLHDTYELGLHSTENVVGAWKHFPIPEQSLSCPIQSIYEAINPPPELNTNFRGSYDDSNTILGFKTVRLHNVWDGSNSASTKEVVKWTQFLTENFPCARFVFNTRGDIEKQIQSWFKAFGTQLDGNELRDANRNLAQLAATLGPERARMIDMSEWSITEGDSGLAILNDLVDWLGFEGCRFSSLIHMNKGGYEQDNETKLSLGKECHLRGE